MKRLSAAALIAIGLGGPAWASQYVCTINGWHSSRQDVFESLYAQYMEEPIHINRETGEVYHRVFGNTYFNNIYLLNRGSSDWSFKVMSDSGRVLQGEENFGGHTHYLEVEAFYEGEKPFTGVVDGTAFWGMCR
jgi:hypothetical protein